MDFIAVYITTHDAEEARRISELLLEKRLVASVNILDWVSTSYILHGKIEHEKETMLIAKTRASLFHRIKEVVKKNHSYDVPTISALPLADGSEDYFSWIYKETK
jgi:periplasmic divalent cation tolerance protein